MKEPLVMDPQAFLGHDLMFVIYGYLFIILLIGIFTLICCILRSAAFYTLAKRRHIRHPWLSWLTVGDMWILGSLADQYQYVVKKKICRKRKILLGLSAVSVLLTVVCPMIRVMITIFGNSSFENPNIFTSVGVGALMMIVILIINLINSVFRYIASYDLFASCNPDTRTVFLVLGVIIPMLLPFFYFADRKKDYGMPPRIDELSGEFPGAEDPEADF